MNKEQNLNEQQNQQLNIAGVRNSISFREMAEKLWDLLDDIDTASDMFKPQDEKSAMAFYKYAMKKQEERHKYLKSDGYKLYTSEEFEQLPKSDPQFGVSNSAVRPPLGLVPKWVRQKERYYEVCGAIARYYDAGKKIPIEWVEEYNELVEHCC